MNKETLHVPHKEYGASLIGPYKNNGAVSSAVITGLVFSLSVATPGYPVKLYLMMARYIESVTNIYRALIIRDLDFEGEPIS